MTQDPVRNDADRVRKEYSRRAADPRLEAYYRRVGPALLRSHLPRRARLGAALDQFLQGPLRVIDVGAGPGHDLAFLAGERPYTDHLVGLDLLRADLLTARAGAPTAQFVVGNAAQLPIATAKFDAAIQTTMLSSVVDADVRARIAAELARIVRPGGIIVSYDMRRAGRSKSHVVSVDRAEIDRLFAPYGAIEARAFGLAISVASRVPPWLAVLLDRFPPMRSHLFVIVRRHGGSVR